MPDSGNLDAINEQAKDRLIMRVTFIAPTVNMSGGIKVAVIYAQRLMAMGHDVRIVSPPSQTIPIRAKLKSWLKGNGWPAPLPLPKSHLDNSGVLHHVLDRWRPVEDQDVPDGDVVIATWWETAEWVNALSPSKGAKVYFIQHHEVFPHLQVERSSATYRMPLHKVVIARWLQDVMRSEYGDHVVDLVPNSVDHSQFFAPPRGKQSWPTVGVLYHSGHSKGLDASLAALKLVHQRFPDLRVISFGSERPNSRLVLPTISEFFFDPAQSYIRELYSRCDVWLTASRTEGFNLPALEAMACRIPVVSTRAGWPEEGVVSGRNGVLVDVDDIGGLAEGVNWVLSRNDADWRALSSNAYETAVSTSWEQSASAFEMALDHACRRSVRGEVAGKCTDERQAKLMISE